ncbi:MAG TPA: hypothetical protein VF060_21035 [Trebonia sp.]
MSAGRLLTLKTVIAVVGLSGGSVALASATGHLPAQLGGHPAATSSASSAASASADARNGHQTATPSPAVRGLCHAYTAGAGSNPGKALDNPAFSALISAAGGKDKVPSYCTTVLTSAPRHSADHGTGRTGSGKGDEAAAGKPTAHPTPASGTHPASNSGGGNSGSGASSAHVSNQPAKARMQPSTHPKGKPSLHPAGS